MVQAVGETSVVDTDAMANVFYSYGVLLGIPVTDAALDEIMAKAASKDADWVTDKVLEVWVDDDDERSVLNVLWKYARTLNRRGDNYLDVVLDAIRSYSVWFDYGVGESIKGNGLDKLFAEMEGDHADELRRLVDNYSRRYAGYRGRGNITRIAGAVTAFLPGELKTRLSALNQQLAGRTTVLATEEEMETLNSTYGEIRDKASGFLSVPAMLLQPIALRAALVALIPLAAAALVAMVAAVADVVLFIIALVVILVLIRDRLLVIMERLATRPKPEPAAPPTVDFTRAPANVNKPVPTPTPYPPPITVAPPVPKPKPDEEERRRKKRAITLRLPRAKSRYIDRYESMVSRGDLVHNYLYSRPDPSDPRQAERWRAELTPDAAGGMDPNLYRIGVRVLQNRGMDADQAHRMVLVPPWSQNIPFIRIV